MSVLSTEAVACAVNGTIALRGVSLELDVGERVGIIGPNGAGKTTLLNAVCGLVALQEGRVRLNGVDVTRWSFEQRARHGLVRSFEDGGVWRSVTVLDNVAVGGVGLQLHEARGRAEGRIKDVGLTGLEDLTAGALSLGQRRRMELARVLLRRDVLGPRTVVVLDEPFRGLDREIRPAVVELLERHLGSSTLLMVEHDHLLARALCSRLVYMKDGRVAESEEEDAVVAGLADTVEHRPGVSPHTPVAVEVRGVQARCGGAQVLHGVNLTIRDGEAVHIAGPNGSGKTTLLRVLMGLLVPDTGSVALRGRMLSPGDERWQLRIAYAPQQGPSAGPSVLRQLALARRLPRRLGVHATVEGAFQSTFPETARLLEAKPGQLSSGWRSFVGLWIALATEPEVLFLDEPGAGLGPDLRCRLYGFLRRQWLTEGRVLVFVEHGEPQPWARPIRLEAGRVVESAEASDAAH